MAGRRTELLDDLGHGALGMRVECSLIGVLIEIKSIWNLLQELLHARPACGEPITDVRIRVLEHVHASSVGFHCGHRGAIDAWIDDTDEVHASQMRLACQGHSEIAGGGLDERGSCANIAGVESCFDKGLSGSVFGRAAEVELLEFREDADIVAGIDAVEPHEGSAADGRLR